MTNLYKLVCGLIELLEKKFHEDSNRYFFVVYFICVMLAIRFGPDFFTAVVMVDLTPLQDCWAYPRHCIQTYRGDPFISIQNPRCC